MIRIRWETDYGLILLAHLADGPPSEVHTAREVAARSRLPVPMVSKVLKTLAREGILVSQRGVKGGYSLAQRPEEISLAEVIQALEGPIGITECASNPGGCEKERGCPLRHNWVKVSQAIRESLEKIPLSEMIGEQPQDLISLQDRAPRGGTAVS